MLTFLCAPLYHAPPLLQTRRPGRTVEPRQQMGEACEPRYALYKELYLNLIGLLRRV